mmetsp:Transcript_13290/g.32528  ORF Transcript_13290/g.32528 Transcript_13290/m.32528 type:complete len:1144 (+) Transcript_13290:278-3709(+)
MGQAPSTPEIGIHREEVLSPGEDHLRSPRSPLQRSGSGAGAGVDRRSSPGSKYQHVDDATLAELARSRGLVGGGAAAAAGGSPEADREEDHLVEEVDRALPREFLVRLLQAYDLGTRRASLTGGSSGLYQQHPPAGPRGHLHSSSPAQLRQKTPPRRALGAPSTGGGGATSMGPYYQRGSSTIASSSRRESSYMVTTGGTGFAPKPPDPVAMLQNLRNVEGQMGVDIGGTLAKLVLLMPAATADRLQFPSVIGRTGKVHHNLDVELSIEDLKGFLDAFSEDETSDDQDQEEEPEAEADEVSSSSTSTPAGGGAQHEDHEDALRGLQLHVREVGGVDEDHPDQDGLAPVCDLPRPREQLREQAGEQDVEAVLPKAAAAAVPVGVVKSRNIRVSLGTSGEHLPLHDSVPLLHHVAGGEDSDVLARSRSGRSGPSEPPEACDAAALESSAAASMMSGYSSGHGVTREQMAREQLQVQHHQSQTRLAAGSVYLQRSNHRPGRRRSLQLLLEQQQQQAEALSGSATTPSKEQEQAVAAHMPSSGLQGQSCNEGAINAKILNATVVEVELPSGGTTNQVQQEVQASSRPSPGGTLTTEPFDLQSSSTTTTSEHQVVNLDGPSCAPPKVAKDEDPRAEERAAAQPPPEDHRGLHVVPPVVRQGQPPLPPQLPRSTGESFSSSRQESQSVYVMRFLSGGTHALEEVVSGVKTLAPFRQSAPRRIAVAGGGAHKYRDLFKQALNLDFQAHREMESVVEGLRFVLERPHIFRGEILTISDQGDETVFDPDVHEVDPVLDAVEVVPVEVVSKNANLRVPFSSRNKVSSRKNSKCAGNYSVAAGGRCPASPRTIRAAGGAADTSPPGGGAAAGSAASSPTPEQEKQEKPSYSSHMLDLERLDSPGPMSSSPAQRTTSPRVPPQQHPMWEEAFLVVNIGSGVSILHVTPDSFARVGGTGCGGGTFLGLTKLLCGTSDFAQSLELASGGDAKNIDTLVSDIYGHTGSAHLGLPPSLTASNFGKLGTLRKDKETRPEPADLARAVLQMVTQQVAVLAVAYSQSLLVRHIFFVGGFFEKNKIAKTMMSKTMRDLKKRAFFVRHSDFLGAIGSLAHSMKLKDAAGAADLKGEEKVREGEAAAGEDAVEQDRGAVVEEGEL